MLELSAALNSGKTTSAELVERALERIADAHGEGSRAFLEVYGESAREHARICDQLRKLQVVPSLLAGIPVSIKDIFDVAGEVTRGGSRVLSRSEPALRDAPVVMLAGESGSDQRVLQAGMAIEQILALR